MAKVSVDVLDRIHLVLEKRHPKRAGAICGVYETESNARRAALDLGLTYLGEYRRARARPARLASFVAALETARRTIESHERTIQELIRANRELRGLTND